MTIVKTTYGRRSFIKTTALAGGGFMLGISWLAACKSGTKEEMLTMPKEWFNINGYLKIGDNGAVTISIRPSSPGSWQGVASRFGKHGSRCAWLVLLPGKC